MSTSVAERSAGNDTYVCGDRSVLTTGSRCGATRVRSTTAQRRLVLVRHREDLLGGVLPRHLGVALVEVLVDGLDDRVVGLAGDGLAAGAVHELHRRPHLNGTALATLTLHDLDGP